jgi:predicted Rossmann fold nucleotide-binding protein DprA/Smf involved in DNA uptake
MSLQVNQLVGAEYPSSLQRRLGDDLVSPIWSLGNLALLDHQLFGWICSARCPGEVILKTYDLARALRDIEVAVIGGFHSPMEKESLDFLLRGTQPVIVCPARSLDGMRVPVVWRKPLEEGRLLLLSPFQSTQRRKTADLAQERNRLVLRLADLIFVAHAAPGGKTEALSQWAATLEKPMMTFGCKGNEPLMKLGATPIQVTGLSKAELFSPTVDGGNSMS